MQDCYFALPPVLDELELELLLESLEELELVLDFFLGVSASEICLAILVIGFDGLVVVVAFADGLAEEAVPVDEVVVDDVLLVDGVLSVEPAASVDVLLSVESVLTSAAAAFFDAAAVEVVVPVADATAVSTFLTTPSTAAAAAVAAPVNALVTDAADGRLAAVGRLSEMDVEM